MKGIAFASPEFFYLLLLVPVIIAWYWRRSWAQHAPMVLSSPAAASSPSGIRSRLAHLPFVLRMLVFVLLVAALARPQSSFSGEKITTEGIDIILCTDVSSSMLAQDFRPNRLEAAKAVAFDFIDARPNDRIGLVVFAGESFTQCPLTIDHAVVKNLLKDIRNDVLEDGTAIGSGLATSVNRIRTSVAKSKVIILLTDGVNNAGSVDPATAAEIARQYNVRVYTVGVGTTGVAPYPVQTPFGIQYQQMEVKIDEPLLKQVSGMTGGKYFRATGKKQLAEIYREIDRLEKTKLEVLTFSRKTEKFMLLALAAGILLALELACRYTFLRHIP